MEEDTKGKSFYSSQEITTEEKSLKNKTFNFFYSILKDKKEFNLLALSILIIFEMVQLISYAFDDPHLTLWRINSKSMNTISIIVGALRILPLMNYVNFRIYLIIFFFLIIFIFGLCLFITMQILFSSPNSKIYTTSISFSGMLINPLTIFLCIPIIEIVLLPLKCKEGKIDVVLGGEKCWEGLYYLYMILGIIACILFLVVIFFLLTFYFSPFQYHSSTIKLTSANDIILFISKFIFILRFIFIKNQYISIILLLLLSLFLLVNERQNMTYNNHVLKIILNIRNIAVFWTYLILFLSKICENSDINGLIYLLLFGYPIIIYCFIIQIQKNDSEYNYSSDNFGNINDFLNKTRLFIRLIDSFLDGNKNINNNHESENQKNEIILKGTIKIHNETCVNEECPLTKFIRNPGNYHVQKQCLLNYMNIYFDEGIKKFPESSLLLIYYIQFNYSKRYNLNSARTNLFTLQKMQKNYHEEFIIFCIEQDVKKMKNKISDSGNDTNELELENDLMEQKYQRLKFLIENSTKLYGEFYGIFATNVTNNVNTLKLYTLGEKLNKYLNEINNLYDNEIKTKKLDLTHISIIQLYARFLKEILWNNKKSEEIAKKIREEHHHRHEIKKMDDDYFHSNNMDTILENQDYIFFCSSNEKGKCNIIQCSNSVVHLFGYQKSEIIGKPIEVLMPNIFSDGHVKMLEEHIKKTNNNQNTQKDNFKGNDNKQIFILPKNKMGYLLPLNSKFIIYDDNDFSNTYIIKVKLEQKDSKSVYAYYVLAKNNFTIDSISSSALNLKLSMDLLKKYAISLDKLIRNEKNEKINFNKVYQNYIDEPKKVYWIYPDIIYPKDDKKKIVNNIDEESIENTLSKAHNRQLFMLQINEFKYNVNEILGYGFKFVKIDDKKNNGDQEKNKNINKEKKERKSFKEKQNSNNPDDKEKDKFIEYIPTGKQQFLFDLLKMNYIRTILVTEKSGLRNLSDRRDLDECESQDNRITGNNNSKKNQKKRNEGSNDNNAIYENSDENENDNDNELSKGKEYSVYTPEKRIQLEGMSSEEIFKFIKNLPFYGENIVDEKHHTNKTRYTSQCGTEPIIKISLDQFKKSIEKKIHQQSIKKKNKNLSSNDKISTGDESGRGGESHGVNDFGRGGVGDQGSKISEDLNREFSSDTSTSLSNIFNAKSIFYIKLMSFIIFLTVCLFISLEFSLTYINLEGIKKRIEYMENGYKLLSNIVYTKYFVTEAVFANELKSKLGSEYVGYFGKIKKEDFILNLKRELSNYREEFTDTYNSYSSPSITFSDEYNDYITNTNVTILSFSNGGPTKEEQTFSSAMNRIPTSVFYVSTVTDLDYEINMEDRNTYELMKNLLNSYFMTWKNVTTLLVNEIKSHTVKSTFSIIILVCIFILTLIFLFIIWKLLLNFSMDREKPINLFLTIKKNIFEDLKNASENFSNKLLNKLFGNEENEEEAQPEYQKNIKESDIVSSKFQNANETKIQGNKDKTNIVHFLKIIIFFIVCDAYIVFKFIYSYDNIKNMSKFTDVYDTTHFAHTHIILCIDVLKSYLFDEDIPIFYQNSPNTLEPFLNVFYNQTKTFQKTLQAVSKSDSFLDGAYQKKICEYLYGDFSELIKNDIQEKNDSNYYITNFNDYRFKPLLNRLFEDLKYLSLQYLSYGYKEKREQKEIDSGLSSYPSILINDQRWNEVNILATTFVRYWFKNILILMNDSLNDYVNKAKLIHITVFIILIVFIALAYCIVWKTYEETLNNMLKRSFNLINLIPEEIKYMIVTKLNESSK